MFTLYLRERWAWIVFFLTLLGIVNLLFYLDTGFSGVSVGYYNLVIIILFVMFFIWRSIKETVQLKNFLGNISENNYSKEVQFDTLSPFQRKYNENLYHVIQKQRELLNLSKVNALEDTEDVLAWIHEMKTPITAMKLMIEQIDDSKLRQKLEIEWLRINYLLDQQLHNTRLSTIEKDNRFEKLHLKTLIHKDIRDFQSWCMEKGIGFQLEGLDCEVITDRKWFSFIVRQILSNAIKYSYENKEIQIDTKLNNNEPLLLRIKDVGIGILEEDLPRIFQKSFTGTVGRESFQSTGMGLYLANNAAKKLGIKIHVESKQNEGTTFTLQFPNENEYQGILGR